MNYFLPDAKITRDQGKVFLVGERKVVPLLHPAAALRSTEMMKTLRESFKKLSDILEGKNTAPLAPATTPNKKQIAEEAAKLQDSLF